MNYKGKTKSKLHNSAEGYNLYAEKYDESQKFLNSFEKGQLFSLMGDLKGKKVLDVGCGTGRLIGELKLFGADIVACDVSSEMLKITKKKYPAVETVEADIEDLPFEDKTFDVVIATFMIVHLKFLERAFEEVYRVLKDGGVFILTNINQRRAPKLKTNEGEKIVISSFYHRPEDVLKVLEGNFFDIDKNEMIMEGKMWINQIVRAVKK